MPDLIYEIPTVQLAIYCSLFFVGLTWFGLIFVKPFLRLLMGRDPRINDWVGQTTAGFSLFYGLLLGLLAVAAYQNFDEVRKSVFAEFGGPRVPLPRCRALSRAGALRSPGAAPRLHPLRHLQGLAGAPPRRDLQGRIEPPEHDPVRHPQVRATNHQPGTAARPDPPGLQRLRRLAAEPAGRGPDRDPRRSLVCRRHRRADQHRADLDARHALLHAHAARRHRVVLPGRDDLSDRVDGQSDEGRGQRAARQLSAGLRRADGVGRE